MKIIMENNQTTTFATVAQGGVFSFGEDVFLKTENLDGISAVNLKTGGFTTFKAEARVSNQVNSELTVKE